MGAYVRISGACKMKQGLRGVLLKNNHRTYLPVNYAHRIGTLGRPRRRANRIRKVRWKAKKK